MVRRPLPDLMHRTLELTVPPAATDALTHQLKTIEDVIGLTVMRGASLKPPGDVLTVHVLNRGADEVLRRALAAVGDPKLLSVVTSEVNSLIAPASHEVVDNDRDEAI